MIKTIDNFLDTTTMYRLILYYLLVLIGAATFLSTIGLIHYSVFSILASTAF